MSKRKLETAEADLISSVTDGEAAALREILQNPLPELKALTPLLERLKALCETCSQPPHRRVMIPVRAIPHIPTLFLLTDACFNLMFLDTSSHGS